MKTITIGRKTVVFRSLEQYFSYVRYDALRTRKEIDALLDAVGTDEHDVALADLRAKREEVYANWQYKHAGFVL